jgi:DNA-binding CsgD family transcriptional regulator
VNAEAALAAPDRCTILDGFLPSDARGIGDRLADEGEFARAVAALFDHSGIGLAVLDPGSRIREANDAFCRYFGHNRCDLLECEFTGMLHPRCRGRLLRELTPLTLGHTLVMRRSVPLWTGEADFVGELTGIAMESRSQRWRMREIVILVKPDISRNSQAPVAAHKVLTDLDARILEGVAAGKSTVNLAAKLHLSRQGIEYHIGAMFRRFNVSNRTALASKAYAMGLLSASSWPPRVPPVYRNSA